MPQTLPLRQNADLNGCFLATGTYYVIFAFNLNWFNLNLYTKKPHCFRYAHGSEHIAGEELLHVLEKCDSKAISNCCLDYEVLIREKTLTLLFKKII